MKKFFSNPKVQMAGLALCWMAALSQVHFLTVAAFALLAWATVKVVNNYKSGSSSPRPSGSASAGWRP